MSGLLAIGLVVAVAAIALLLRRSAVTETARPLPSSRPAPDDDDEPDEDEIELAITTEGVVFMPDGATVRLIPVQASEYAEEIEAGLAQVSPIGRRTLDPNRGKPGSALSAGDFTAARIRRGAADVVPWVLETLGRDGEFIPFPFETEDGARAALKLIEMQKIVRRPLDEEGRPIPASIEDFEEARRRYDDSWRALSLEQEPGDHPGPPYSDRR